MNIEVWSDIGCPWCYLGLRRLEAVRPPDATVTVRAFQLGAEPEPLTDEHRTQLMSTHVTELAAAEGLTLDFTRVVPVDTFDAHRLVAWAATQELQLMMVETLQRAHFEDGADVGSHTELARLAGSIGLDEQAALAYLASPAGTDAVNADLAEARELGISSVPTVVVDRRFVIQGAQETAVLRTALDEIARREAVDSAR
ncbi:DsbA family protein [Actinoplanes sp. N902-109]|uniref:DsbA family oxidoreductase n=1 Tax=Actinoplanes sp. (strain N902-109) TaxID=649831 RepID=UPI0003294E26|nr:DsbA family oxidoreductase [Actinoplanes sp. N902-109]AGL13532.1 DSBA oxidoreductase [Actinoplanes sp. N902-109]